MNRRAGAFLLVFGVLACHRAAEPEEKAASEKAADLPTPVRVAAAEKMTIPLYVSGPGKTAALAQQKVRAPFAGTLVALSVVDGDRVRRGQPIGTVVAKESEAALSGAREMLRQATTPADRSDAERAVALAEKNLVPRPLLATVDGSVLAHTANTGDRVSEDQEIVTISEAGSVVFLADVPQTELPRIHAGQEAIVDLAGGGKSAAGTVHSVMPSANPVDFTAPVRVDLRGGPGNVEIGLFGNARIRVGERAGAIVVPSAAVIRDDVSGISRVCLAVDGKAHWIDVSAGVSQEGKTEIVSPPIEPGQAVIVSGVVGLPEGKPVSVTAG
jgi:multidrug efflux pump subunit AcrA (membrane-fusion protein)